MRVMEARRREQTEAERSVLQAHELELLRGADGAVARQGADEEAPASDTSVANVDLHVCESCGSDLVYPLDWAPAATKQWQVQLRCPDCEWRGDGVYDQAAVDAFDIVLDEGSQAVLDDLTKLTHANMSDDIERFVDALSRDLILPEDF